MKITIQREGDNITTAKDFSDVHDRGEIAHFICELESLQSELQMLWEELIAAGDDL